MKSARHVRTSCREIVQPGPSCAAIFDEQRRTLFARDRALAKKMYALAKKMYALARIVRSGNHLPGRTFIRPRGSASPPIEEGGEDFDRFDSWRLEFGVPPFAGSTAFATSPDVPFVIDGKRVWRDFTKRAHRRETSRTRGDREAFLLTVGDRSSWSFLRGRH